MLTIFLAVFQISGFRVVLRISNQDFELLYIKIIFKNKKLKILIYEFQIIFHICINIAKTIFHL